MKGLVYNVVNTATGKFTRKKVDSTAALIIWKGNWLGALPAFIDWVLSLGAPLLLGLLVMGCVLAPASYFLVRGLWRLYVLLAWRKRRRQRLA